MKQFTRYIVVGALNSVWSYLLIFGFMYLPGYPPEASNVLGYAIGLLTSYALHRRFTFASCGAKSSEFFRFLGTFAVAFLANFAMLFVLVRVVGVHAGISQILSGVVYVGVAYLLNRSYVFPALRR